MDTSEERVEVPIGQSLLLGFGAFLTSISLIAHGLDRETGVNLTKDTIVQKEDEVMRTLEGVKEVPIG
jgi:capsule polysaccharide export protein KpsC/LpsZ